MNRLSALADLSAALSYSPQHAAQGKLPDRAFPSAKSDQGLRIFLLLLLLLAFFRLTFRLGDRVLWWDESLSLERAELDWIPLLFGRILLRDGVGVIPTVDQHPFGFFALLKGLIWAGGTSEFVLRLPAVMASTLLVVALYVLACFFVRRGVLPKMTVWIAPLLAAVHPFYLWYGQEARMYTSVALFAVLSTYLLLRWWQEAVRQETMRQEEGGQKKRAALLVAYAIVLLLLCVTHYFAILILPIHGLLFFLATVRRYPRLAVGVPLFLLLSVGSAVGLAAWLVLRQENSGVNFQPISLQILLPDLVNAYSLGLSVDIAQVLWIDVLFAGLLLLGGGFALWGGRKILAGGWVLPGLLIIPILLLLVINLFQPAYMNARHLSIISGFFVLLVAAGAGVFWRWHWLLGGLVTLGLVLSMGYSSVNYFTEPAYQRDDFRAVGTYLEREMQPGDVLVLNPPELMRLYEYYLPIAQIETAQAQGVNVRWLAEPTFASRIGQTPLLAGRLGDPRRVWLISSGMYPYGDPEESVLAWLQSNFFQIREANFRSNSSFLTLTLFLTEEPGIAQLPASATAINAYFGEHITLLAYEVGYGFAEGVVPVTFYWQTSAQLNRRYKYRAVAVGPQGERFPVTEREPYDGLVPTTLWPPHQIIREFSDLNVMTAGQQVSPESLITGDGLHIPPSLLQEATFSLALELYDSETLEKLPVHEAGQAIHDGTTLQLPLPVYRLDLP